MKRKLLILIYIMVLTLSACNKHDQVLPVPSGVDSTALAIETETAEEIPPSISDSASTVDSTLVRIDSAVAKGDSAFYHYATFADMPYRILLPKNYDATKRYPLLLFLHGIGERGTDNESQLTWGASLFQADSIRNKYPAIVIFPQCPVSNYWFDEKVMKTLNDFILMLTAFYPVNEDKMYVAGLSMGGYGTYALVAENPGVFAAAIAISGDGDANKAADMAKTSWRIFAGAKDNIVPSSKSNKMAEALEKSGASVSFKLYPNADHTGSWVNAFAEPDFCSWLFSISRSPAH
jgi:predicted peptidase